MVHTDACKAAAGIFYEGDWFYVHWKKDCPEYYDLHINYKEVMAVVLASEKYARNWANADITVITDSSVAKAIINKGTCKK